MKIYYDMNVSYRHAPGEWCPYLAYDTYTLCCFQTPFLYECDGGILEGNAGDLLLTEPDRVIYHGPRPDAKPSTGTSASARRKRWRPGWRSIPSP